mgnify:CR=1 FL=1
MGGLFFQREGSDSSQRKVTFEQTSLRHMERVSVGTRRTGRAENKSLFFSSVHVWSARMISHPPRSASLPFHRALKQVFSTVDVFVIVPRLAIPLAS